MKELEAHLEQTPLAYLLQSFSREQPSSLYPANDILGLVEHGRLRAADAALTFANFDHVAKTIIEHNPGVRKKYLADECVEVADLQLGAYHRYSIHRFESNEDLHYTVERTDIGSQDGGFKFVRNADGTVFFSLKQNPKLEPLDEDSLLFSDALGQAKRFIELLATSYNVTLPQQTTLESNAELRERMARMQKLEDSLRRRSLLKMQKGGASMVSKVLDLFTTKSSLGERAPRYGRIALFALLLPAPAYSERFHPDIPIPRPASIELGTSVIHRIFVGQPPTPEEIAQRDFQQGASDLPPEAYDSVTSGGEIAVITDLDQQTTTYAKTHSVIVGSTDFAISGAAPQKISLRGNLTPGRCFTIPIDADSQTGTYGVAMVSENAAADLRVSSSRESVEICNAGGFTKFFDANSPLYIDVSSQDSLEQPK